MEYTFSVVIDVPEENLTAELCASLMLAKLDEWKIEYHSAQLLPPGWHAPMGLPVEFEYLPCESDPDPIIDEDSYR